MRLRLVALVGPESRHAQQQNKGFLDQGHPDYLTKPVAKRFDHFINSTQHHNRDLLQNSKEAIRQLLDSLTLLSK
jgi:hypothetical protein